MWESGPGFDSPTHSLGRPVPALRSNDVGYVFVVGLWL